MDRHDRLDTLRDLIRDNSFRTQADLVEALAAQGMHVTQSSVSRDVNTLGLIKVDGVYTLPDALVETELPALEGPVWRHLSSLCSAGEHMIVARVAPATAPLVGAALDALLIPGIAGTIAGDDTVFIALSDARYHAPISEHLRRAAQAPPR